MSSRSNNTSGTSVQENQRFRIAIQPPIRARHGDLFKRRVVVRSKIGTVCVASAFVDGDKPALLLGETRVSTKPTSEMFKKEDDWGYAVFPILSIETIGICYLTIDIFKGGPTGAATHVHSLTSKTIFVNPTEITPQNGYDSDEEVIVNELKDCNEFLEEFPLFED